MFRRLLVTNGLHYFQLLSAIAFMVFVDFSWWGLLVTYLAVFAYGGLGVEVNSHRYFSHGTFEYRYKWMEYVFSWFQCLGGTGSPIQWVATHGAHHEHTDEEGDPHDPKEKGLWMFLYLTYPFVNKFYVRHMVKDKYQRWIHKNILAVVFITWAVLYAVGGLWLVVYGAWLPTVVATFLQIVTTYVCHIPKLGYRRYDVDDDSVNVWWWAPFDFGDGLHNTHHANPHRYNLSDKWWEIDIAGFVIKYFLKKKEV